MNKIRQNFRRFLQDFHLVLIMLFYTRRLPPWWCYPLTAPNPVPSGAGSRCSGTPSMFADPQHHGRFAEHPADRILSALIATIIGTAASIAISSMKQVPQTIVMGITNIPMLNADIVTGISLMSAFIAFGVSLWL